MIRKTIFCQPCKIDIEFNNEAIIEHTFTHCSVNAQEAKFVCFSCGVEKPKLQRNVIEHHFQSFHKLNNQKPDEPTISHKCVICEKQIPLHQDEQLRKDNINLIQQHYLQHFPKDDEGNLDRMQECIFFGCKRMWTKRRYVLRCFSGHEQLGFEIQSYTLPQRPPSPLLYSSSGESSQSERMPERQRNPESDADSPGPQSLSNEPESDVEIPEHQNFLDEPEREGDVPENENILDQDGGDNEERELEEDNALPFQEPPHNLDMIDEQLNLFQKLKTENNLSEEALNCISESFKNMEGLVKQNFVQLAQKLANEHNVPNSDFTKSLMGAIENADGFLYKEKLSSTYQRNKLYEQRGDAITPTIRTYPGNHQLVIFPFKKLIQRYFNQTAVKASYQYFHHARESQQSRNARKRDTNPDQVIVSCCQDGKRFQDEHSDPSKPERIPFIFYNDEFGLNHALGSRKHSKNSSICGFYGGLLVAPNTASQKKSILCLGLILSHGLETLGLNAVFAEFKKQIDIVHNTDFFIGQTLVHVQLQAMVGDSKALNPLAGFAGSFSPKVEYLCRLKSLKVGVLKKKKNSLQAGLRGDSSG